MLSFNIARLAYVMTVLGACKAGYKDVQCLPLSTLCLGMSTSLT